MKKNNSLKKLLVVFASFTSVAAIGLSTISCGHSHGLNAEDGHWVEQYGSNELKELYYTGVANKLYKSNDLNNNPNKTHKVDSVKDMASNSYIDMKEYLLLNNLWSTANASKNYTTSGSDLISNNMMKDRDWTDYKTSYASALKYLQFSDLHKVLNGTWTVNNVKISPQQIVEILNIYYNLNQDVRITINKQMIDMYYLEQLVSYSSIYSNSYLVQAIQQYKPAMLWSVDNTKDNTSSHLTDLAANMLKVPTTNGTLANAKQWNTTAFNTKETTDTWANYYNTETIAPQYKLSSLGIVPKVDSFTSNTTLGIFNQLYNYQGMKFLGDKLVDNQSTESLFKYTQKDQINDLSSTNLLYTYKTKNDGTPDTSTKIYVQGKTASYHIYYDKRIANVYTAATSGLPFGQFKLATEVSKSSDLERYVALQLSSKIETDALSLYQTLYYINVHNDDVKKVQPAGTGKDN